MKRMLKLGVTFFALSVLLTACSTKVQPCPPARSMTPPVVYLQEVAEPYCAIKTNGDLVDCLITTRAALKKANSDKTALRKWAVGQKDE